MFSEKDIRQIESKGMRISLVEKQLESFRIGFPGLILDAPATIPDGIKKFTDEEVNFFSGHYPEIVRGKRIVKFVPASGAATRMFKSLYAFREKYRNTEKDRNELFADKNEDSVFWFIDRIKDFAFYNELKVIMESNEMNPDDCITKHDYNTLISFVLDEDGLNYGALPKALIKFHNYPEGARTAAEEHLVEGAIYARDSNGRVQLHFTLSSEHVEEFNSHMSRVKGKYEKLFGVKYDISHSVQKPSTDTVAVDENNELFRERDGDLLFRPGGHGALIENLNDLKSDIVVIKNIDNIVPDSLREPTYIYKKLIIAYLNRIQAKVFEYLMLLDQGDISDSKLSEIVDYCEKTMFIRFNNEFSSMEKTEKTNFLFGRLNRPIRVCGMVKNEGDTGGGPFWVKGKAGEVTLQIVETSQINLQDKDQERIFKSATHFNPVDVACSFVDFKGNYFNLSEFVDENAGFISTKSKDGRTLKAIELPGLWNGAMSDWISVFVEVPLITFNPVKVINDLLKKEHQTA
jgi:hypothetical protein